MEIALIYARAANGAIGQGGQMPWHLPEDLAHFRALTQGAPVLMGRKTWDSLPARFRPLPGRQNIVITRQENWHETGAQAASSLREALQIAEQSKPSTVWIIGGAQIYAQALALAQRVEVTEIARDFEGDAFAPVLGQHWQESARQGPLHSEAAALDFSFVCYRRCTL